MAIRRSVLDRHSLGEKFPEPEKEGKPRILPSDEVIARHLGIDPEVLKPGALSHPEGSVPGVKPAGQEIATPKAPKTATVEGPAGQGRV